MKKLFLLTKTLLVAVCLLVGATNAWGATTWKTFNTWDFVTGYAATDTVGIKPAKYWTPSGSGENAKMTLATTISSATAITESNSSRYFGLLFQGEGTKIILDKTGVVLGGGATKITIPDLKKGQRVTVTIDNANGVVRDASSTATLESFSTSSAGDSQWKTQGVVTTGGNLVIARNGSTTFRVKSILIETPYTEALTLDFDDAETYLSGWSQSANYNVSLSQIDHGTGKALYLNKSEAKRSSTLTYSFSNNSSFVNATDYRLEFDWATCGIGSNNSGEGGIKIYSGSNVIFSVINSTSDSQVFTFINGTTFTCTNNRASTPAPWLHIVLHGTSDGIYATVTNITANPNTTLLNNVKVYSSAANITSFVALSAKSYQNMYLDDIIYSIDLTEYKSRASDAISTYSSISSSVMNSTVYSTLNSAYSTLTTNYDTDDEIEANIPGYISAIKALESANEDAQTSVNNFIILNELIANANSFATTVTEYNAPSGAESVYTEDADVDPVSLANAVRNEISRAGAEHGNNTDISAIIVNKGFEMGSILGWNVDGDPATGGSDIDNNGGLVTTGDGNLISGTYTYYTGWNGRNINQTISGLPAGNYKLTAKAKSWTNGEWRCTIALVANGGASTPVSMEGGNTDLEYEFTVLGSETSINIGIAGTNGASSPYPTGGTWGYFCDDFTLTYVGQDPVAQAKASLEAEIATANTLKDSWTPKVGTAPFKYDATYYNALGTQITSATSVLNSGSETVSDYTTAESALETAESNMASSTQNTPDPDKYYQIFVANNDGTASNFNLYMLKEKTKTQVTVSATPYPVKITKPNTRYRITTPYGSTLCTDYTAVTTAYTNGWDGAQARCSEMQFVLNDNGSITIQGYRDSKNWYNYSASASEGAGVTANTGLTGKWVISDAVEVTDVNLAVNATTGWGTFIAPYDNLTPSTVKAFTVSHKGDGSIYFTENETGVLSANTPYILSTEEVSNVSVAFKGIANNDENTYEVNGLVGLLAAETVPANSYILQYQAGKVGTAFYKLASDMTGTAYRCYLDLASVPTEQNARATVRMNIFGGITGVENVEVSAENALKDGKYLENGKIVIVKAGKKFSATGAKLY